MYVLDTAWQGTVPPPQGTSVGRGEAGARGQGIVDYAASKAEKEEALCGHVSRVSIVLGSHNVGAASHPGPRLGGGGGGRSTGSPAERQPALFCLRAQEGRHFVLSLSFEDCLGSLPWVST